MVIVDAFGQCIANAQQIDQFGQRVLPQLPCFSRFIASLPLR